MIKLSLKKLRTIVGIRGIKGSKSMSEARSITMLDESKLTKKLTLLET